MTWRLLWQPPSRKDLRRLDPPVQERIIGAVVRLARTGEGDVKKLKDVKPPEWRLRVGRWRVRFRRNDSQKALELLAKYAQLEVL